MPNACRINQIGRRFRFVQYRLPIAEQRFGIQRQQPKMLQRASDSRRAQQVLIDLSGGLSGRLLGQGLTPRLDGGGPQKMMIVRYVGKRINALGMIMV